MDIGMISPYKTTNIVFTTAIFLLTLFMSLAPFTIWVGNPDVGKNIVTVIVSGFASLLIVFFLVSNTYVFNKIFLKHITFIFFIVIIIPILLSLRGGVTSTEISGFSFEFGTLVSFTALFIIYCLGFFYSQTKINLYFPVLSIVSTSIVVLTLFVIGTFYNIDIFQNIFGGWLSTQLFLCIGFLGTLFISNITKKSKLIRVLVMLLSVLFVVMIVLSTNREIAILAGLFGSLLSVWRMTRSKSFGLFDMIPIFLSGLLIIIGFFFSAYFVSENNPFSGISQDIRPSQQATLHTTLLAYDDEVLTPLIGFGVNSFARSWVKYRPDQINGSSLWDEDFSVGYGSIPTMFITHGFLFTMLLLLGACSGLTYLFYLFSPASNKNNLENSFLLTLIALFIFIWSIINVPNLILIALATLSIGLVVGERSSVSKNVPPFESRKLIFIIRASLIIIFLILGLFLISIGASRALAIQDLDLAQKTSAKDPRNYRQIVSHLKSSLKHDRIPETYRVLMSVQIEQIDFILNRETIEATKDASESVKNLIYDLADAGDGLTEIESDFYRNWILRGDTHLIISLLGLKRDNDDLDTALTNYRNAVIQAPNHPTPYFLEAKVLNLYGRENDAVLSLEKALKLKPDYIDKRPISDLVELLSTINSNR